MASGHVNRTKRPNTWQHRPSLRREDFLAKPEPSTHGTKQTNRAGQTTSVVRGRPECAGRPARSRWCKSITMKE